ncbi:MAG: PfkB family carbohydrate kinase, partial [Clostridia bacterium]|nr:PfkB family carbohydrate kinase [Clostridia bacterium]
MIYSVGEILADLTGNDSADGLDLTARIGGAPFNLAVNAKKAGAKVGFYGKVGNDVIGKFLVKEAEKFGLDELNVSYDTKRNTTLAFVALKDGERDFSFFRYETADVYMDDDFHFEKGGIVHVGSLMLSTPFGRKNAIRIMKIATKTGNKISFDVNFRSDIFRDKEDAINTYLPYIE